MTIGAKLSNNPTPLIDSKTILQQTDLQTGTVVHVKSHNSDGKYVGNIKYLVLTPAAYTSYTGSVSTIFGDVELDNTNIAHALTNDIIVSTESELIKLDEYKNMRVYVQDQLAEWIYIYVNASTNGWEIVQIDTDQIAIDAVTVAQLANNSVDTGQLIDDAVTTDKIESNAVTSTQLANSSVTFSKLNLSPQSSWTGSQTSVPYAELDGDGMYVVEISGGDSKTFIVNIESGKYGVGTSAYFTDSGNTYSIVEYCVYNSNTNDVRVVLDDSRNTGTSLQTIVAIRKLF